MSFYSDLPDRCFWRRCLRRPRFDFAEIYRPAVTITAGEPIATAGSCFAQKIGRELKRSDARFLDLEPAPPGMSEATGIGFGYGLYSARYGNIYTTAQLLQLAEDAFSDHVREDALWTKDGTWFDGLRPRIEPGGFARRADVVTARRSHLRQVRRLFTEASVFVFTLGLTERWEHAETGTVYQLCPATVDPAFGAPEHRFHNTGVSEVVSELTRFIALVRTHAPDLRFLFTVSPVPLAATATGGHVLPATIRSKSVLRAAVDEVVTTLPGCDYFPAYEIATANPLLRDAFDASQREVKDEVVTEIMTTFFAAHPGLSRTLPEVAAEEPDTVCDEILLDASRT